MIQCAWALVTPLVHKLQGLLWSTTYISVYLISLRLAGLFVPYFKGTHIKKSYGFIIFLNALYVLATILYFYDQHVFLWAEVFLTVLFCINAAVLNIGWDLYVVDTYSRETFENFKYAAHIRDSIGGIGGYSIVIWIYSFLNEAESMRMFMLLVSIAIIAQLYNYFRHYRKM
jgi:hypothetical protein